MHLKKLSNEVLCPLAENSIQEIELKAHPHRVNVLHPEADSKNMAPGLQKFTFFSSKRFEN